ncbi:predicted protein [Arabidopsis lyrata subsp. lyrata]|uniref:Predicted protein n=1 Tax=Arabidopsis lyrata subsp. lyrata TaxID=81972 RepID=D7KY90_ARALL|nr:predicted protein [Arabidopsis lyrata subsp. lyrata]
MLASSQVTADLVSSVAIEIYIWFSNRWFCFWVRLVIWVSAVGEVFCQWSKRGAVLASGFESEELQIHGGRVEIWVRSQRRGLSKICGVWFQLRGVSKTGCESWCDPTMRFVVVVKVIRFKDEVLRCYFWWLVNNYIGLRWRLISVMVFGIWDSWHMVLQGFALWSKLINSWGRFELRVVRETNGLDYRRFSTQARGCDESKSDNGTQTATWLADSNGGGICHNTQSYVHVDYVGFNLVVNYMEEWKTLDNFNYKNNILARIRGVFNKWFSGDRSGRALITLLWTIVGGRNFSKRYDVGRLSLDFKCMEWSFSGCNKRFSYGWISGFSWLDMDILRVRISRVNCDWISLRTDQGSARHNSTHHGTVKGFTGGRNPPKPKVDK